MVDVDVAPAGPLAHKISAVPGGRKGVRKQLAAPCTLPHVSARAFFPPLQQEKTKTATSVHFTVCTVDFIVFTVAVTVFTVAITVFYFCIFKF